MSKTMNGNKRAAAIAGLLACLLALTGCGGKTMDSTAQQVTVIVKGKPAQSSQRSESSRAAESSEPEEPKENTFVDESGEVVEYKDMLTGICTAYTGDSQTAVGPAPEVGVVAVDPDVIPYGTRLYITAADGSFVYGYAVAADTGDAMVGGGVLCDLYLDSEEECDDFGRQEMVIYLLPDEA